MTLKTATTGWVVEVRAPDPTLAEPQAAKYFDVAIPNQTLAIDAAIAKIKSKAGQLQAKAVLQLSTQHLKALNLRSGQVKPS